MKRTQDETGKILYSPSMPGNKTGQALPYFFDEVLDFVLRKQRPRAAYGAMQDQITDVIRAFRDISNKNVYFSAKN